MSILTIEVSRSDEGTFLSVGDENGGIGLPLTGVQEHRLGDALRTVDAILWPGENPGPCERWMAGIT